MTSTFTLTIKLKLDYVNYVFVNNLEPLYSFSYIYT